MRDNLQLPVFAARDPDVPLTDAQRTELDRRLDDLEREGPVSIAWDDVLDRLRSRHR